MVVSNTGLELMYSRIHEYDIVSFDVFDTLLLRNVVQPVDIFKLVEIEFNRQFSDKLSFYDLRIKAEIQARANSDHEDILLDDIYHYVQLELGEDIATRLIQLEIETEKRFLVANEEIRQVYEHAKSMGKTIYIISDMYLPEYVIEEFLHSNGIFGYNQLFVSGQRKVTKATGSMYDYIREHENLDTDKRWVHIGDNEISDYKIPLEHGIESIHYIKPIDKLPAQNIRTIGDSIVHALKVNANYALKDKDYWYQFGFNIAGQLFIGLMFWLAEQIRGKDNIYFLARDGYIPYELYKILREYDSDLPEGYYLIASRRAYIYAQLHEYDLDYALDILTAHNPLLGQRLMVREILDNIGLQPDKYQDKLATYRLNLDSVLDEGTITNVKEFLTSIWDDIVSQLINERKCLMKYFDSMDIAEYDQIHIFDIGWRGSTHLALQRLVNKPVTGYYLGTTKNIFEEIRQRSFGYAFDKGSPRKFNNWIFDYIMIFELVFSAPHGSLIKFENVGNGEVRPVLKNVEKNDKIYECINKIKEGVIDLFNRSVLYSEYMDISREFALTEMFNLISRYKAKDLLEFSKLSNSVGLGESQDIKRYVSCYDVGYYLRNRKNCDKQATYNLWKHAILLVDDQGRHFNQHEIQKLYNLKRRLPEISRSRYLKLILKALKNPRKALRKLISIIS